MNTEEITHILKHFLVNSRARFLGVFASDKLSPLNSIQSHVPCCYVSNTDPTGKCGSHWVAFFTLDQIDKNFLIVMKENLANLVFISKIPSNISQSLPNPGLWNPGLWAFLYIHSLSSGSQLFIAFNM